MLMNEVFGEQNFIAQLVWKSRQFPDARAVTRVSTDHEYIVIYARRSDTNLRGVERDESKFSNPDNDPRGTWMSRSLLGLATAEQRPNLHYAFTDPATGVTYWPPPSTGWRYSEERMKSLIKDSGILFPSNPEGRPREKKFRADLLNEFVGFPTIIEDVFTAHGTAEIREIFEFQAFDFPKPSELIRRFVEQTTTDDDLILDPFAGSASAAHAVLTQNRNDGGRRRFICVQLPEPIASDSEVAKRGFGTVAEIGKERVRRVVSAMEDESNGQEKLEKRDTPEDLGFKVFKLTQSNYRPWQGTEEPDPESYVKQMELHADPLVYDWKAENVLWEVTVKEGFGLGSQIVRLKEVQDCTAHRVIDPDRGQSFVICLDDKVELDALKPLNLGTEDLFICRDSAITDEAAANLALQCRLKTI
jgi:adenine-specific DNA-methyltransferase